MILVVGSTGILGGMVTWINNDEAEHTVTTKDKLLDSPHLKTINVKPGDSFSFKFEKAGTYEYFCSVNSAINWRTSRRTNSGRWPPTERCCLSSRG